MNKNGSIIPLNAYPAIIIGNELGKFRTLDGPTNILINTDKILAIIKMYLLLMLVNGIYV